jgi:hypothetical protein
VATLTSPNGNVGILISEVLADIRRTLIIGTTQAKLSLRVRHSGRGNLNQIVIAIPVYWEWQSHVLDYFKNIINEIHWWEKIKNLKVTHGRVVGSEKG